MVTMRRVLIESNNGIIEEAERALQGDSHQWSLFAVLRTGMRCEEQLVGGGVSAGHGSSSVKSWSSSGKSHVTFADFTDSAVVSPVSQLHWNFTTTTAPPAGTEGNRSHGAPLFRRPGTVVFNVGSAVSAASHLISNLKNDTLRFKVKIKLTTEV